MAAADIRAGRAYVELYVKNREFLRGLRNARERVKQFGADVRAAGQAMAALGGVGLLGIGLASKRFADFDDQMRAVKAVSQANQVEFEKLTAKAKALGAATSFTAVEVAGLMAELGRAGFKPDQIEEMTGAVLDLARATQTDATLASGIMAASIRQFSLAAGDATRVADALTAAANGSFNTVEQLGEALSYAGPVANDFNMSIEETLAILGTLGNVGIQASNAGTALRRLLTLTGAEAEKLKGIFGVSFQDAAGNARPLVDVLQEVNEATANMGTGERAKAFNEAFGLLGITGASAIARNAQGTRDLLDAIQAAGGQANKTAKEMDSGLGGSLRMMWSAIEGVGISIGESLAKPLSGLADIIQTVASESIKWIEANREAVIAAALVAGGVAGAGVAMIGLGGAILAVNRALAVLTSLAGAVGAAFTLLVSPLRLALVGFAAIRGTLVSLTAAVATVRAAIIGMGAAMFSARSIAMATAGALAAFRGITLTTAVAVFGLRAAFVGVASGAILAKAATLSFTAVGAAIAALTNPVLLVGAGLVTLGALATKSLGGIEGIARGIHGALSGVGRTLSQLFTELLPIARTTIGGISDALTSGNWAQAGRIAVAGLRATLLTGVAVIAEQIDGIFGNLIGRIGTQLLSGDLSGAWSTVLTAMHAQFKPFVDGVLGAWDIISEVWHTTSAALGAAWTTTVDFIAGIFGSNVSEMGSTWGDFVEGMVAVFTQAARHIADIWESTVKSISSSILEASANGGVFGKIASTVLGVDMAEEQRRSDRLNAQLGLGRQDVLAEAQAAANSAISGQAAAFRARLDGIDQRAQGRNRASAPELDVSGEQSEARSAADRAKAELDRLREDARKATLDAKLQADQQKQQGREGMAGAAASAMGGMGSRVVGSFSAAALSAMGGAASPTERIAKGVEKTVDTLKELVADTNDGKQINQDILQEIRMGGMIA